MRPRTIAIVQARMRSTRFPGKVLQPVAGLPLLDHIIRRLQKCRSLDGIAIATSTELADDAIAAHCNELAVQCIRGPEDNVLRRYLIAARETRADIIVRITSDAPLIDPDFIDYLVGGLIANKADFVVMARGESVAHEGADPFTRSALEKLAAERAADPVAKEHVSAYFKLHPEFVRIAAIPAPENLKHPGFRLSIDTPSDRTFIEAIYEKLHAKAGEASLSDLIALIKRDPSLLKLNAHVQQKPITSESGTIIFRCDGGGSLGFGHIKRSLAIARHLRDRHGFGVRFAIMANEQVRRMANQFGFPVDEWYADESEAEFLSRCLAAGTVLGVVFDTRIASGTEATQFAKDSGATTAVIDDAGPRRLVADLAFYPPVPQVAQLNWRRARTRRHVGWEWAVLGSDVVLRQGSKPDGARNILITMGGSDPAAQTLPAARAALRVLGTHTLTIALGPDVPDTDGLIRALRQLPGPIDILQGQDDLGGAMATADLAITSFGVTAYELAAYGVPALYLGLTQDHLTSARAFEEARLGQIIGLAGCGEGRIAKSLSALLESDETMAAMRTRGPALIDGQGAARVADAISEKIGLGRNAGHERKTA